MVSVSRTEESFRPKLERIFREHGLEDFKWIIPEEIVVSHWVRMRCHFGCPHFGAASCPPNNPPVSFTEKMLSEYSLAVVFRLLRKHTTQDEREKWVREMANRLLDVERLVFLSGYYKTFLLSAFHCELCEDCVTLKADCKVKGRSRPTAEGMGIDVFATVSEIGYPIEVLQDRTEDENRYAILLIR
jgi:predicted metal-binding protein